jgi:cytochrome c556
MRLIATLLLGLAIGIFGTVSVIGAMKQQIPYSHAVMAVSAQHFGALRKMSESGKCEADPIALHLRTLRVLADDLEPAFLPTGGDDALFKQHGIDYAKRLDGAIASAPATCEALGTAIGSVGAGCKACHQDFKP